MSDTLGLLRLVLLSNELVRIPMVTVSFKKRYLYLQNGVVNLVQVCCGIDSNPLFSIVFDNRGAGMHPTLALPSGSENGNMDGKSILSGYRRGILLLSDVE